MVVVSRSLCCLLMGSQSTSTLYHEMPFTAVGTSGVKFGREGGMGCKESRGYCPECCETGGLHMRDLHSLRPASLCFA
jgi:hypothetical protein